MNDEKIQDKNLEKLNSWRKTHKAIRKRTKGIIDWILE